MVDAGGVSSQQPLYVKYPISSQWEFLLKNGQSVKGEVYCTDAVSDLVIIQDSENDIRMISVSMIDTASRDEANEDTTIEPKKVEAVHAKKALDEREKRAIRMAQESLKHLNPKVRRSDGSSAHIQQQPNPLSRKSLLNQFIIIFIVVLFRFSFRVNGGTGVNFL